MNMTTSTHVLVYVVEDDTRLLAGIMMSLADVQNCKCEGFATLREAREALKKRLPDILFCDHVLETENGIDLLVEVKAKSPATDCILVSGKLDTIDQEDKNLAKGLKIDVISKNSDEARRVFRDRVLLRQGKSLPTEGQVIALPDDEERPPNDYRLEQDLRINALVEQQKALTDANEQLQYQLALARDGYSALVGDFLTRLRRLRHREEPALHTEHKSLSASDIENEVRMMSPEGIRLVRMYNRLIEHDASEDSGNE